MGKGRGRHEPGSGDAGAGAGASRACAADPVAAAVRRRRDRCVPGAGRHRGAGGASVTRGAEDSIKRELAAAADANLAAYDAFLRGEAASPELNSVNPQSLRQAIAAYEEAVAIDSTFVEAWARLGGAQATLYANSTPTPEGADAARCGRTGRALAPKRAESHQALALYHRNVRNDNAGALSACRTAVALAPGNAELLSLMGIVEFELGRLEDSRQHLEQAARLDPRSSLAASLLGSVMLYSRRMGRLSGPSIAPCNLRPHIWTSFRIARW